MRNHLGFHVVLKQLVAASAVYLSAASANAQSIQLQPTDSANPVALPSEIEAQLDDPFFKIVIKPHPQVQQLQQIIDLVQDRPSDRKLFVVGEHIGMTLQSGCSASRRTVMAFSGTNKKSGLVLDNNVFFSFFLSPIGPTGDLEVIAWDQKNGTYNYYRLDSAGAPKGQKTWKLRNISTDLRTASPKQLSGSCLRCHVNGGPVMKEFSFPWNNWHSSQFRASYLQRGQSSPATEWPSAKLPILQQLSNAEQLEAIIQSSLQRFADSEINRHLQLNADGSTSAINLTRLLSGVFQPTELNLVSSATKSGLDGGPLTSPATSPIKIPDSFFVNIGMMRDLGLPALKAPSNVAQGFTAGDRGLSLAEYRTLTAKSNVPCLNGQDTIFAWFGPEISEFDRTMVARLVQRRILDPGFVAAVLAIDLENPMFSDSRAGLLKHVPDSVTNVPSDEIAGAIQKQVIANLEAVPAANRAAAESDLLDLLTSNKALDALNQRVEAYWQRVQQSLDPANPTARQDKLGALFRTLQANRDEFRNRPISTHLVESDSLFPN